MRVSRMSCVVVSGAMAVLAIGAAPASAKGKVNTSLTNWNTGKESSRWNDTVNDSAVTAVKFSNCSAPSSPGKKASAVIALRRDDTGPDPHFGQSGDVCSGIGMRWGAFHGGQYYFTLDKINGTSGPGTFRLNANPVEIWY